MLSYVTIGLQPNWQLHTSDTSTIYKFKSNNIIWDLYENHIDTPSTIIKRNKISLHIKTIKREQGLTKALYESFPSNFLTKEIGALESTWGFNIQSILMEYKGTKLIPKQIITSIYHQQQLNNLEHHLNHSTWHVYAEKNFPLAIPKLYHHPKPELLKLRYNLLFPLTAKCTLCQNQTKNPTLHTIMECEHSLLSLQRNSIWKEYTKTNPELTEFIKSLNPMVAARVMTGLQSTNSPNMVNYMLDVVQNLLCKMFED